MSEFKMKRQHKYQYWYSDEMLEVKIHTSCEYEISQWTLIGNIYQDPELLK